MADLTKDQTGPGEPDPVTSDPAATVKLTYQGTYAPGTDGELQHGKTILPFGVEVEVPADVAEHLTTGENKALYKIKVG